MIDNSEVSQHDQQKCPIYDETLKNKIETSLRFKRYNSKNDLVRFVMKKT